MWNTKFDLAMVAFLDCLQQLAEEVNRQDRNYSIPYKMDKGKIEDKSNKSYSVKYVFTLLVKFTFEKFAS